MLLNPQRGTPGNAAIPPTPNTQRGTVPNTRISGQTGRYGWIDLPIAGQVVCVI